ncbi:hypothetical protein JOF56_007025 [Kibdelosporangium banguiense]|uniref:CATRA-Associated Small Protein domain-containing protein n=1 Tax=Kibdelosporangium banguiense TaxID=1365924 RepID=A0ABS4TQE7_9PSEU|nr:CATRA system-associated protein [Kibdelosporangium banguiense]MBP2326640.1 hypothetical protein [Kibdelosporangium banguiense]
MASARLRIIMEDSAAMPMNDGAEWDLAMAEARAEAHRQLKDVLAWRFPEPRWQRVAEIVQSIDDAVRDGDLTMLESATAALELQSSYRITRIGSDKVEAPAQVRERVNRLQHTLTESAARPGADDRGDDGHDGHDRADDRR